MRTFLEQWKDVPGFEGRYQVSNLGRIKSLPWVEKFQSMGRLKTRKRKEIIMTPVLYKLRGGYFGIGFGPRNNRKNFRINRLVAEAFVKGKTNKKCEVNHINGNKLDNRACNLEWVTHRENMIHAINNGLWHPGKRKNG